MNIASSTVEPNGQDSVFGKDIGSPLSIKIIENHLAQFKLTNLDIEQRIFALQVITSADSEVFIKYSNYSK